MEIIRKPASLPLSDRASFKLIFILSCVVLLFCSAAFAYFSITNANSLKTALNVSMSNLMEFSRLSMSLPLWELHKTQLIELLWALLRNDDIVAAEIYDGNTFLMGYRKNGNPGQNGFDGLTEPYKVPGTGEKILSNSGEITFDGKTIGRIEFYYSTARIQADLFRRNFNLILIFLAVAFAIIGSSYLFVARTLVKPILSLAELTKSISGKNIRELDVRIDRRDEVGILYHNFENMLTSLAASQSELKKTQGFLSNIIESMPSMLITIDDKGTVTQWNHAAELETGISALEMLGKNIWDRLSLFHAYRDVYSSIIENREPQFFYRQRFSDPKESYKNVALFPLVENGIKGLVIRVDDITELERKDEQLRQAQKMDTIGTLAGGIAHDFNNILGGIVGTLSILQYRLDADIPLTHDELKETADTMEQASLRATDLVQQLLTLSRKRELNFVMADLRDAVARVVKICNSTFDKSIEISEQFPNEPAIVKADISQIEQVILNLCVNASHAMTMMRKPEEKIGGKLVLSIETLYADSQFCLSHPEAQEISYWILKVLDTGIGISQKVLPKIFDPFFTTKDKGKGTGLGLSMVYNIVKQHGGFIDVYSEVNVGSCFNVFLPAYSSGDGVDLRPSAAAVRKGTGLVLVIDDEELIRKTAKTMLETCGYEVLLASSGDEGIEKYREKFSEVRMVLLDMIMPKKSGEETYLDLCRINQDVKVLLSSGFKQDERVESVMRHGIKHFIQKPYTLQRLSQAVYDTLSE